MSVNRKTFFALWVMCIVGSLSVLPYVMHLDLFPPEVSRLNIVILTVVQSSILFGVVCWLSSVIVPRTDLAPFPPDKKCKGLFYPGMVSGALAGVLIVLLDRTVFQSSSLSGEHPPFWAGALASIYGAVNEEVLLRLFLFSLVYFLLRKFFRSKSRQVFLWITNVFVAFIFGLGHLPAALKLADPTAFEISRVLILNGIPGIVFGRLYWTNGFCTAMAAHFTADLIIHVLFALV